MSHGTPVTLEQLATTAILARKARRTIAIATARAEPLQIRIPTASATPSIFVLILTTPLSARPATTAIPARRARRTITIAIARAEPL